MKACDLLITNGCLITMDPERRIISDGMIAVKDGVIEALGRREDIAEYEAAETIDAGGMFIFPGMVSTHTHSFQMLTRGLGRDLTLFDWLDSSVRYCMHNHTEETIYQSALICAMESLRSGMTTTLDYEYAHPRRGGFSDVAISAFRKAGIRCVFGRGHGDMSGFAPEIACDYVDTEQYFLDDSRRLAKLYPHDDMMRIAMAPGLIFDQTPDGVREMRKIADEYGIMITMHMLETPDDNAFSREKYGMNVTPWLEKLGFLGPDYLAVHCVDMNDDDFALFKQYDIKVCHCPNSNMILASGIAPVARMLEEGLTVSLGVDGASSNDTQNMLNEMRMATMLQKAVTRNPKVVPAGQALELATLGGARALGMDRLIGSLETGKKADMFFFDTNKLNTNPTHDPITALVYNAEPENIHTVIVDGRVRIRGHEFVDLDEEKIKADAQRISRNLVRQSRLEVREWNQVIDL